MEFADILAALAFLVNGLPVALMAIGYGFASVPTGLAYIVGAAGMLISGQTIPIGFQAESVVLAGQMGRDRQERINIVFYTGIIMTILGVLGILGQIVDFIGPEILYGMMAGIGIILAKAGTDMFKTRPIIALTSLITAGIAYFAFDGNSNQMVYMVVISVGISSILHLVLMHYGKDENKQVLNVDMSIEKFIPIKFKVNPNIVRSTLALCAMQIGANIAFTEVMADFAGTTGDADAVTIYSGIGDSISAAFGGGPVEGVISGTAFAPNPITAGVLFSIFFAVLLFSKSVPKLAKYMTTECVTGFLVVVGALSIFSGNALTALQAAPLIAGMTIVVTSVTDPFLGMVAGLLVRLGLGFI